MATRSPRRSGGRTCSPKVSVASQIGPSTRAGRAAAPASGAARGRARSGDDRVLGSVERRPHELGHPGIEDHQAPRPDRRSWTRAAARQGRGPRTVPIGSGARGAARALEDACDEPPGPGHQEATGLHGERAAGGGRPGWHREGQASLPRSAPDRVRSTAREPPFRVQLVARAGLVGPAGAAGAPWGDRHAAPDVERVEVGQPAPAAARGGRAPAGRRRARRRSSLSCDPTWRWMPRQRIGPPRPPPRLDHARPPRPGCTPNFEPTASRSPGRRASPGSTDRVEPDERVDARRSSAPPAPAVARLDRSGQRPPPRPPTPRRPSAAARRRAAARHGRPQVGVGLADPLEGDRRVRHARPGGPATIRRGRRRWRRSRGRPSARPAPAGRSPSASRRAATGPGRRPARPRRRRRAPPRR